MCIGSCTMKRWSSTQKAIALSAAKSKLYAAIGALCEGEVKVYGTGLWRKVAELAPLGLRGLSSTRHLQGNLGAWGDLLLAFSAGGPARGSEQGQTWVLGIPGWSSRVQPRRLAPLKVCLVAQ